MYRNENGLYDITPTELVEQHIPDRHVIAIWVNFQNALKRKYTAVHIFNHPTAGFYILLSSNDKNRRDFLRVGKLIAEGIGGQLQEQISDRVNDICDIINFKRLPLQPFEPPMTQLLVAEKCVTCYARHFSDVRINAAYYSRLPIRVKRSVVQRTSA